MDPLGLVYGGQGTGGASILGGTTFDPIKWSQDKARKAEEQILAARKAAQAAKEANIKFQDIDYSKAWQPDLQEKVLPLVEKYRNTVRPYYDQGIDINSDTKAWREVKAVEDEVTNAIKQSQYYQNLYNLYTNEFAKNEDRYEPETASNIIKFVSATDDKMRDELIGKVLVPKFDVYDPLKEEHVIPATKQTTVTEKGDVTTTVTEPSMPNISESANKFVNSAQGKEWFEKAKAKGIFNNEAEAKKWLAEQKGAKVGLVNKTLLDEPKVDRNLVSVKKLGGGRAQIGKYVFTKTNRSPENTFQPGTPGYIKGVKPVYGSEDFVSFQNVNTKENNPLLFFDDKGDTMWAIPKGLTKDSRGNYKFVVMKERKPTSLEREQGGGDAKYYTEHLVPYQTNEGNLTGEWGGYTADEVFDLVKDDKTITTPSPGVGPKKSTSTTKKVFKGVPKGGF